MMGFGVVRRVVLRMGWVFDRGSKEVSIRSLVSMCG
jgi:hypothetical protein